MNPKKSTFKHIYIKKVEQNIGKDFYEIRNRKNENFLGNIFWYSDWKQYVFDSEDYNIIFSVSCLRNICEFIEGLD